MRVIDRKWSSAGDPFFWRKGENIGKYYYLDNLLAFTLLALVWKRERFANCLSQ
jgi:hypothetical protein